MIQPGVRSRIERRQRPLILVSACLAGEKCRYDGRDNAVEAIVALKEKGLCIPVCPEVLGDLPTPRIPSERQGAKVIAKDGTDVSHAFKLGARRALYIAMKHGLRLAILKSRSPSCGFGSIYDGTFSHRLVSGNGIFAAMLEREGFSIWTEENCAQLLETSGLDNDL